MQASTQAKSLDLLSSGIYTEEERFVFELLQNAVDAYNGSACLRVKILLLENYLVFMHNGDCFTERDIEGLCDVGYGNKTSDIKKIGYKGIGFKSVFMHSHLVTVQSGGYCFKFEKKEWEHYWDANWGEFDISRKYAMPWQIIPIETNPPLVINTDGFNVITYIYTTKTAFIKEKIQKLFSSSRFLLFLRHAQINIDFIYNNRQLINLNKKTFNNVVQLSTNETIDSNWLVYCNPDVKIDDNVRDIIIADGITPTKLQDARTFDLSFALPLDNKGYIMSLENSCVYTYLPTSISFGFPFLVNANFITDAGRQHLVKDSEWNKMIIRKIPREFLNWIATISQANSSYYRALPATNIGSDVLSVIFNNAMAEAIRSIAFIPSNKKKGLLKASNAIMDRLGITDVVGPMPLITYVNKQYREAYTIDSFINVGGISILKEYGVFDLNTEKLESLLADEDILQGITVAKDIELIRLLYNYDSKSGKEYDAIKEIIPNIPFIFSDGGKLCKPTELFFSSKFKDENNVASDVNTLHPEIYNSLCSGTMLKWFKAIGVNEMDDNSIIANHICANGYITEENAIAVGRYLFEVWECEDFTKRVSSYKLANLKFKTNNGTLKTVDELYQGSKYYPAFDLQPVCDADMFISDEYCDSSSEVLRRKWHRFFCDIHICDDICLRELKYQKDTEIYDLLKDYVSFAETHEYNHSYLTGGDYYMHFTYINVKYVPYIGVKSTDLTLAKIVWSHVMSQPVELSRDNDYIFGSTGYNYTKKGFLCDKNNDHDYLGMNFLQWVIHNNYQTFPSSTGEMLHADKLYRNTNIVKELFGNYLPYIDVDCEIDQTWIDLLKLKTDPSLNEYLLLLANISQDLANAERNKNRITNIYNRIVEIYDLNSDSVKQEIESWGKVSKIMAGDGLFYSPSALRYITIDGFAKTNLAYIGSITGNNKDKVIQLLKLMGVTIITNNSVTIRFDQQVPNDEIRNCLISKTKVLALLKAGENPTEEEFNKALSFITNKIKEAHFYHCEAIKLTYGDDEDTIDRTSFGADSNFYYVGEVRLSKVDSLLTPLCDFINIRGKERELLVTMFEDTSAIREYLLEKEYNVSFLDEVFDSIDGTFSAQLDYARSTDQMHRDAITGFKGEILVYEKLKECGYNPICMSITDKNNCDECVEFLGKTYYCRRNNNRYDIEYTSNTGKKVLVEVKTTTLPKQLQTNMPISYNEIKLVEQCSMNDKYTYRIVRVFDINGTPDIYIFEGRMLL